MSSKTAATRSDLKIGSNQISDQSELLQKLKGRDPQALSDIVLSHSRSLFRASLGMGFRAEEAEDLVQDVFIVFLETLDRFEGRSQVRTWLFGILHRKALERRRSRIREERQDPIDEVMEARFNPNGSWACPPAKLDRDLESKDLRKAIEECMERLPELQRRVFVLRDMEEVATEEVCKILDISSTNMFVLTFRARNRLRECLERKMAGKQE